MTATVQLGRHLAELFQRSGVLGALVECNQCRANIFWGLWDAYLNRILSLEKNASWGIEWEDAHIE